MYFLYISSTFIFSASILYILYLSIYFACFIEETLSLAAAIKAGAERVAGITREQYMKRLVWLREATRWSILFNRDDKKKPAFVRISNVLESLRLDDSDGRIRKQPFCVGLCGAPGCGKTGTAMKIAASLMKQRYGKFSSTDVVTLNETDEFQSEFRSNNKVVIFDDIAAENSNRSTTINPWRKLLDFVNNIRKTSLNPNVELKGNVYIEPDLVIFTTNRTPDLDVSPWMACPEAIFRRISALLYLYDYEHAILIPRTEPLSQVDIHHYHTYSRLSVFDSKFNVSNIGTTQKNNMRLIDDLIEELTRDFVKHMDEQEKYVHQINSLLDIPEKESSSLRCFYDDQIYPLLPKKVPLPIHIERLLPWHERIPRKFCVEGNFAICQMNYQVQNGESEIETSEISGDEKMVWLDMVFDEENYRILSPFFSDLYKYLPTSFGFYQVNDWSREPIVSPLRNHLYKDSDMKYLICGYSFTPQQLKECYETKNIPLLISDDTEIIESPIYEGEIQLFVSHNYDVKLDDNHLKGKAMKTLLRNCQRKLAEMNAIGNLPFTPSSFLTYEVLRRAFKHGCTPVGVEYGFNGLTVDGCFRAKKGTMVLIEAKTMMDPRPQIKRYIKDYAVQAPVIGIGINYTGYWVYHAGDADFEDLVATAMVCSAVFRFFNVRGKHLAVSIPYKKYKVHDDTYTPPKKIYT
jgi:ABC-type dipeptide/oligopeptide/nickel transport system ATPase subunit